MEVVGPCRAEQVVPLPLLARPHFLGTKVLPLLVLHLFRDSGSRGRAGQDTEGQVLSPTQRVLRGTGGVPS